MNKHEKLEDGECWALLDCDDVLVDWVGGFRNFISDITGKKITTRPDSWDMSGWLQMPESEVRQLINRFNETENGFEALTAIRGAQKALSTLKAFGFKIAIITSSSVHPASVERRARNVTSLYGNMVERLHIVPLGQTKKYVLNDYKNAIWVEDNPGNAELGASLGHRAFLLEVSHNVNVHSGEPKSGVVHVKDWDDLLPMAVSLLPDPRAATKLRDASLKALEKASEASDHGQWTPRNPDSDAMKRLLECGMITLTPHPNRKPTAELTAVGAAILGIDVAPKKESEAEFEI